MAIISEQNNNNKMEQTSFADKKDLPISFRSIETPLDEICKCIVGRCTYTNMVFGDQFSEVEYKNDFTGFIVVSSGYAGLTQLNPIFHLVKSDGSEVEIDTSLFNPPYQAEQVLDSFNNLVGFKIQWRNILIDEGAGKYSFRFEINDFGFVREIYSIDYQLYDFNEAIARDTIKLTWIQNGYVENFDEGVDFTELSFENSLRIGGKVNYLADTLENDEYEDVGRNRIQIQSKENCIITLIDSTGELDTTGYTIVFQPCDQSYPTGGISGTQLDNEASYMPASDLDETLAYYIYVNGTKTFCLQPLHDSFEFWLGCYDFTSGQTVIPAEGAAHPEQPTRKERSRRDGHQQGADLHQRIKCVDGCRTVLAAPVV